MRIHSANIPVQTEKSAVLISPQTAGRTIDRRQAQVADSYARNAQPQIIDAEFVELYSPSSAVLNNERSDLDLTVEPEAPIKASAAVSITPNLNKYQQLSAAKSPRPGSFIDIFA